MSRSVLFVDDEQSLRDVVVEALQDSGYEVLVATEIVQTGFFTRLRVQVLDGTDSVVILSHSYILVRVDQ